MSVKMMGLIWDSDLPRDEKYIALCYADHASHDGSDVYPAVDRVVWKTGYSKRSVQEITKKLIERGVLVQDGSGPFGVNRYRFDVSALPQRPDYVPNRAQNLHPIGDDRMQNLHPIDGGAEFAGVQNLRAGGAEFAPKPSYNRHNTHEPRARATPPPSPDDATDEMTAVLGQVVKNRITPRSEPQFRETANWLLEQGATHDGVRAFAAWFAEFDDGAPWLANVRNEWANYTNGRPPSFAGKSRAKRNGNGASKQDQLEQLKLLARRGTTGYTTETKPELAAAGLLPIVERMGRWADICRLPLERFDIEFYRAWNEVHA